MDGSAFALDVGEGRGAGPDAAAWVDAVEERAVDFATVCGLATEAAADLGQAVREALMNAIRHGGRRVTVRLRCRRGRVLVSVRDDGSGFDPRRLSDPRVAENLERSHGRGVFCMRRLADRISFAFPRLGGTAVLIERRLRTATS